MTAIYRVLALFKRNRWCCQPEYCRANAPADYARPGKCRDCQREKEMVQ